jgi:glycosyltransferase involved in cell wall biosynthesis
MTVAPAVTVLMTVYNGSRYLREAVDSIRHQAFSDFELLVIDDGSDDDSLSLLRTFADARIRIVAQHPNRGIRATLNRGLRESRGRYVAIMDQDDLAAPDRLALQVAHLEANPGVGLCGGDVELFGERSGASWVRYFESAPLRVALLFENPICHPSVMLRRDTLAAHGLEYPEFPYAEEYALWVRLSRVASLANLRARLLRYRTHAQQISRRKSELQCRSADAVVREQLAHLGLDASPRDIIVHRLLSGIFNPLPNFSGLLRAWTARLLAANASAGVYPELDFTRQVHDRTAAAHDLHRARLAALSFPRRLVWRYRVWRDYRRAGATPSP